MWGQDFDACFVVSVLIDYEFLFVIDQFNYFDEADWFNFVEAVVFKFFDEVDRFNLSYTIVWFSLEFNFCFNYEFVDSLFLDVNYFCDIVLFPYKYLLFIFIWN